MENYLYDKGESTMDRNYWQEYWENYYKFMAVYLGELTEVNPDVDIKREYTEVASLFEPSMYLENYENDDESAMLASSGIPIPPFIFPGGGPPQPIPAGGGYVPPETFISPGGGQFTINNCRRMAIVRIEMRRGFNPSNFFMVVDRADNRSIQGFRIACEGNRIRFVSMAVEYRNINFIECAF